MTNRYHLRRAERDDYGALHAVMYDAVRSGPSPYSEAQRAQWLPHRDPTPDWTARLAAQLVVVAGVDERIAGFMTVRSDDYIDLAHICPGDRGRGLFRQLYAQIEAIALAD